MCPEPLLGRQDAIGLLEGRLRQIEKGGGALVFRVGVGIGKTAVLDVAVRAGRSRSHGVLTTTGLESEARLPLLD